MTPKQFLLNQDNIDSTENANIAAILSDEENESTGDGASTNAAANTSTVNNPYNAFFTAAAEALERISAKPEYDYDVETMGEYIKSQLQLIQDPDKRTAVRHGIMRVILENSS